MITVEHLVARRRLLGASQRRHTPRRVPAAAPPAALVASYTRTLLDLDARLNDELATVLAAEGLPRQDAPADGGDADGVHLLPSQVARIVRQLQERFNAALDLDGFTAALDRLASGVDAFSREQWRRQLRAVLGVDLVGDPRLGPILAGFRTENVALIRSLTADKVARVHRLLVAGGTSTRVEELAKQIRAETSATRSRAALIARDQVLKLNGDVTEARHVAAGVVEYVWRTSRDERVRETHRDLDGTRQRYDTPPIVDARTNRRENPGRDYSCRCTAEPVIPGFDG